MLLALIYLLFIFSSITLYILLKQKKHKANTEAEDTAKELTNMYAILGSNNGAYMLLEHKGKRHLLKTVEDGNKVKFLLYTPSIAQHALANVSMVLHDQYYELEVFNLLHFGTDIARAMLFNIFSTAKSLRVLIAKNMERSDLETCINNGIIQLRAENGFLEIYCKCLFDLFM